MYPHLSLSLFLYSSPFHSHGPFGLHRPSRRRGISLMAPPMDPEAHSYTLYSPPLTWIVRETNTLTCSCVTAVSHIHLYRYIDIYLRVCTTKMMMMMMIVMMITNTNDIVERGKKKRKKKGIEKRCGETLSDSQSGLLIVSMTGDWRQRFQPRLVSRGGTRIDQGFSLHRCQLTFKIYSLRGGWLVPSFVV